MSNEEALRVAVEALEITARADIYTDPSMAVGIVTRVSKMALRRIKDALSPIEEIVSGDDCEEKR